MRPGDRMIYAYKELTEITEKSKLESVSLLPIEKDLRYLKLKRDMTDKIIPKEFRLYPTLASHLQMQDITFDRFTWKNIEYLTDFPNFLAIKEVWHRHNKLFYLRLIKHKTQDVHLYFDGDDDSTYLWRRVKDKQTAEFIFNLNQTIRTNIEEIIGYAKDIDANWYVIAHLPRGWTFDKKLSELSPGLRYMGLEEMKQDEKLLLGQEIIAMLKQIHKQGYILNNFNIKNIFMSKYSTFLGNLTSIRLAKDYESLTEMRNILPHLINKGLVLEENTNEIISSYIKQDVNPVDQINLLTQKTTQK